jgi:hypothetical protein
MIDRHANADGCGALRNRGACPDRRGRAPQRDRAANRCSGRQGTEYSAWAWSIPISSPPPRVVSRGPPFKIIRDDPMVGVVLAFDDASSSNRSELYSRLLYNRIRTAANIFNFNLANIALFINNGGFRAAPTPDGVPVTIRSPGSSVMNSLSTETSFATAACVRVRRPRCG